MAREKFHTLTEQMFYILLSLQEELCGADVMSRVESLTDGRVTVGPGTLYHLLDEFLTAGMIGRDESRRPEAQLPDHARRTIGPGGGIPPPAGPGHRL